jgi:hypothetical protein
MRNATQLILALVCLCTCLGNADPASPASENAADLYRAAYAKLLAQDDPARDRFSEQLERYDDPSLPIDDAAKALLDESSEIIDLARRAAAKSKCDWNYDYSKGFELLLPELNALRLTSRLVLLNARRLAEEGKLNQAHSDVAAVFAMAKHHGDEPIMVNRLVAAGVRIQASMSAAWLAPRLSQTQLAEFQRKLKAIGNPAPLSAVIGGERRTTLDYLRRLAKEDAAGAVAIDGVVRRAMAGNAGPAWGAFKAAWLDSDQREKSFAAVEAMYDEAARIADIENDDEFAAAAAALLDRVKTDPMAAMFFPAINKVRDSLRREQTYVTLLSAGVATLLNGPDALAKVTDPSTGRPFIRDDTPVGGGMELISGAIEANGHPLSLKFPAP